MANHDELIAEMPVLEQMGTQERQKLAKKRRVQQLKKWSQREKEWLVKEKQLNKRLATILQEESNGLNLKQYTTYNSNQRNKKKFNDTSVTDQDGQERQDQIDKKFTNNNHSSNNNYVDSRTERPLTKNLIPNGRVHFNVGVMLLEAAARNDYDEVKRLLSLGVSPDSVNHDGLTALHQCCIDASEDIMNLLLESGANVDARDTEQWTPLHAACTCGHLNLVKIMVQHGADLLAVNGDGNMPFDICEDEATLDYIESQMLARGITQEIIDKTRASNETRMLNDLEKLVAEECDPNFADGNGVTQLHIAAANNYLSVVEFLLKQGVDVNVCDNDQWRPIHGAACWGTEQHIKVVELLVEAGAQLEAHTSSDETVFDLCDSVELLERLNQLKDEIEMKQATGACRLKRTQSRTNSRVHSVRRTSVRDKSLISRREAREEALLRVESNEALDDSARKMDDRKKLALNESSDTQSDSSPVRSMDSTQEQKHEQANPISIASSVHHVETNLDHTNRDAQRPNIDHSRNQSPIVDQSGDSITRITNGYSHQETITNVNTSHSDEFETFPAAPLSEDNSPSISNDDAESRLQMNSVDVHSLTISQRPTSDLNVRYPAQSTTIVQVQFTPMNYTLSNLKKHRSDLRMRSASNLAPAYTTILRLGNSTDTPKDTPDGYSPAVLIPASQSNSISFGDATETTTTTFRKFHGEPSETIASMKLQKRHKCCVII